MSFIIPNEPHRWIIKKHILITASYIFAPFLIVLFAGILLANPLLAQDSPTATLEGCLHHEQIFLFDPAARNGSPAVVNELLQFVADGNGKLRVTTRFGVSLDGCVQIVKNGDNQREVIFRTNQLMFLGDTAYQHFSLSAYLKPGKVSYDLVLQDQSGKSILSQRFVNQELPGRFAVAKHGNITLPRQHNGVPLTAVIRNVVLSFTTDHMNEIAVFRDAFSDYYQATEQLDAIDKILESLDPLDFEKAILDEFKLCEAEALIGKLTHASFPTLLPLNLNDPLLVLTRMEVLGNYLKESRQAFNMTLASLDSLYYQRGLENLLAGNRAAAGSDWEKSLVYNPFYMPSHAELGKLDMVDSRSTMVLERFAPLVGKLPLPGSWKGITSEFLNQFYWYERARADTLMNDGRFLDALKLLEPLALFCDTAVQFTCPDWLFYTRVAAHKGMYRSYLSVASQALSTQNLDFSLEYINRSIEYQINSGDFLTETNEADALLKQVVQAYLGQIRQANQRNDFPFSLSLIEKLDKLCTQHPRINCSQQAMLIRESTQQMQTNPRVVSLPVTLDETAVSPIELSHQEALSRINDLISKGRLKAWAAETEEARQFLDELLTLTIQHGFRSDTLINTRINDLVRMIENKECELAIRKTRAMLKNATIHFGSGFYTEAGLRLQEAKEIISSKQNCGEVLLDSIETGYQYIALAAEYQQLLNDAQEAYFRAAQRGMDVFISRYNRTSQYYDDNKLSVYGVNHQSLFEFTVRSSNSSLVKYVIRYLSDLGEPEQVLQLLEILRKQGFDARELNELLVLAAEKGAPVIFEKRPASNPDNFFEENGLKISWYRAYVRQFEKGWPGN